MKRIFINSYYSEIDYGDFGNPVVDGIYSVTFDDNKYSEGSIKKMIEGTYAEMENYQDGEVVHNLGEVLTEMKDEGQIVEWEKVKALAFNCDYGNFN